jgi:hypothetical protein
MPTGTLGSRHKPSQAGFFWPTEFCSESGVLLTTPYLPRGRPFVNLRRRSNVFDALQSSKSEQAKHYEYGHQYGRDY